MAAVVPLCAPCADPAPPSSSVLHDNGPMTAFGCSREVVSSPGHRQHQFLCPSFSHNFRGILPEFMEEFI